LTTGRTDASGDRITGLGLTSSQVDRIRQFVALPTEGRSTPLAALTALFAGVPAAEEAVAEVTFLCSSLDVLKIPEERVMLDVSIARGLDYYTGPVFEAILTDAPQFGSVFGGGRYDGLVERFLGRTIPAVGASIGVDRLFAAMQSLGLLELTPSTAEVFVTTMDAALLSTYQTVTRELREAGINTEMYLGEEKGFRKQLAYANRQQIPLAVIIGGDEAARNEVTVKNLELGAQLQDKKNAPAGKERDAWLAASRSVQVTVPRPALVGTVRDMLAARPKSSSITGFKE
jgi:histidyl-tRNA synthetase